MHQENRRASYENIEIFSNKLGNRHCHPPTLLFQFTPPNPGVQEHFTSCPSLGEPLIGHFPRQSLLKLCFQV